MAREGYDPGPQQNGWAAGFPRRATILKNGVLRNCLYPTSPGPQSCEAIRAPHAGAAGM